MCIRDRTYVDSIITIKEETVARKNVDFEKGSKAEKLYKDLKPDERITIKPTTFSDAMDEGLSLIHIFIFTQRFIRILLINFSFFHPNNFIVTRQ